MQSLLLVSKNKKATIEYLAQFYKKQQIGQFDIHILKLSENSRSIGIEEIRMFQQQFYLKPFKSSMKALVIEEAHVLTQEAQNALLKALEEPPDNTIIILSALNREAVLPTILSRCRIIHLDKNTHFESLESKEKYQHVLTHLFSSSIGEKLQYAQEFGKTKETAQEFLETLIIEIRKKLIEEIREDKHDDSLVQLLNGLSAFQKAYTIIGTTNASPRLALENLFLNLL